MKLKTSIAVASIIACVGVWAMDTPTEQEPLKAPYPETIAEEFVSFVCEGKLTKAKARSTMSRAQIKSLIAARPIREAADLSIAVSESTQTSMRLQTVVRARMGSKDEEHLAQVWLEGLQSVAKVTHMKWGAP